MLSREERVEKFGLDCVSELIWTGWEAGGEFVQDLIIKNVSLEVNHPATILYLRRKRQTGLQITSEKYHEIVIRFFPPQRWM